MRKWVLLLLAIFPYYTLWAQNLVVNAPDAAAYAYKIYTVDSVNTYEGAVGTSQVWDFRNFHYLDSGTINYFEEAGDNPYKVYFPDANYMITDEGNRNGILFFHK